MNENARERCIEEISDVLSKNKIKKPKTNAKIIEEAIYNNTLIKIGMNVQSNRFMRYYIQTIVSIVFNLDTSKELIKKLKKGEIEMADIVTMKPEELNKSVWQELINKQEIENNIMSQNLSDGIDSTLYKCGKCGHKSCKIFNLQTRSVDEGTTTFFTCNNCGNQWKN